MALFPCRFGWCLSLCWPLIPLNEIYLYAQNKDLYSGFLLLIQRLTGYRIATSFPTRLSWHLNCTVSLTRGYFWSALILNCCVCGGSLISTALCSHPSLLFQMLLAIFTCWFFFQMKIEVIYRSILAYVWAWGQRVFLFYVVLILRNTEVYMRQNNTSVWCVPAARCVSAAVWSRGSHLPVSLSTQQFCCPHK